MLQRSQQSGPEAAGPKMLGQKAEPKGRSLENGACELAPRLTSLSQGIRDKSVWVYRARRTVAPKHG